MTLPPAPIGDISTDSDGKRLSLGAPDLQYRNQGVPPPPPGVSHSQPRRIATSLINSQAGTRDLKGPIDALVLPSGHRVPRDCPVFGPEHTQHRAIHLCRRARHSWDEVQPDKQSFPRSPHRAGNVELD